MIAENSNPEDNDDQEVKFDELMTEELNSIQIDLISEIFHDLQYGIDVHSLNHIVRDSVRCCTSGDQFGMAYLLAVHESYLSTTYQFKLSPEQKRELLQMLWREARTPFEDEMDFEPTLLSEEQVEFARIVADSVYGAMRKAYMISLKI